MKFNLNKKTVALIAAAAVVVLLLFCFGGPNVRSAITGIFKSAVGIEDVTPTPDEGGLATNPPTATTAPTKEPEATATIAPTDEPEATATTAPTDKPTNTPKPTSTPKPTKAPTATTAPTPTQAAYKSYYFRNKTLLDQHYEKHGKPEMGFASAKEYEKAASDVINNPNALHKLEKDGENTAYYIEATNEFVVLSADGYIRTYFNPSAGKSYYDRQ